jgi:hypothetical protein
MNIESHFEVMFSFSFIIILKYLQNQWSVCWRSFNFLGLGSSSPIARSYESFALKSWSEAGAFFSQMVRIT